MNTSVYACMNDLWVEGGGEEKIHRHAYTHTHTHTRTHMCTHTHTYTHTHIHTPLRTMYMHASLCMVRIGVRYAIFRRIPNEFSGADEYRNIFYPVCAHARRDIGMYTPCFPNTNLLSGSSYCSEWGCTSRV